MLFLSRRVGEAVDLYDPSGRKIGEVTIERVHGDAVRIGLDFPKCVKIQRRELGEIASSAVAPTE